MTIETVEGRAVVLGDDVNTDNILPGPYLNITDPEELGRHLLETYPGDAGERVRAGDIIVAGANFGNLTVAECPEAAGAVAGGDRVRIDFAGGRVESGGRTWPITPLPEFAGEIVELGGLVPWARRRLLNRMPEEESQR